MKLGKVTFEPIENNLDLVGEPTKAAITDKKLEGVLVSPIDPELSDTQAFYDAYGIDLDVSVNCVIVEAKRADKTWYAACLVPATVRADINGIVRRELGARKISFAPMDKATSLSGMAYGGISPLGLPEDWPVLVDSAAASLDYAVIGSGIRESKLLIPGKLFAKLPGSRVLPLTKTT